MVSEILPHQAEIDPKYTFLFSAPTADGDGNPAQIRFSRKTKEQYVMTEKDGKATGWKAYYENGKWQEQQAKSRASSAGKKASSPRKKAAGDRKKT